MAKNQFENPLPDQSQRFENESKENLILKIEELEAANNELVAENAHLKKIATKDPLTEVYNRRGFMEEISHIMPEIRQDTETRQDHREIIQKRRKVGSVLILDIDDFKKINDEYGHEAGDEILRQAAAFLEKKTRKTDIICRWGGEEFVILLQNIDAKQVIQKFYNQNEKQAQIGFTAAVNGKEISIMFSGGATEIAEGETIESTVAKADEQLYRAKNEGKNRVYRPEEKKF